VNEHVSFTTQVEEPPKKGKDGFNRHKSKKSSKKVIKILLTEIILKI